MDDESQNMLAATQAVLEDLLSGKQCGIMEVQSHLPELQKLSSQINQLIQNLNEINRLAIDLSQGKLDGPIPPRHNYMASPLKHLHSQLSALTLSLQQLQSGYVVSKLADTGELFAAINELIDWVAAASTQKTNGSAFNAITSINSWRYHQILQTLDLLHILVVEVDNSGRVVYANRPAREILGDIEYISEQTESSVLGIIATNIAISKVDNTFPIHREIYEESSSTWYRVTSDRFLLSNGQAFYFNMIEDISEWKINEHRLKLSATVDEMTGTYNRKAGQGELDKILARADPSTTHCIAFIDIDGLKIINDNFGHREGDYAIKSIAKVLLSSVRGSDIVCRYGGDEFLIIFKNCAEEVAKKIITRMHEKLKKLDSKCKTPKPYMLSFSYGVVSFSASSNKAVDLLKLADQKMYLDKNHKSRKYERQTLISVYR